MTKLYKTIYLCYFQLEMFYTKFMNNTKLTQRDGFQAIVLLGSLCQEILETGCNPEKLRVIATEGAQFMQLTQDKMIDAGIINPARMDCRSKDDPLGFFEQQLSDEKFVAACSTPEAKAAGAALREHVKECGGM
jgi:hypothetical protein